MRLRLPDEIHEWLRQAAEADGNSVNSEAVTDYPARRQTDKVRDIARRIAQEDADLLARLGECPPTLTPPTTS
ncbi:Arc family DNA-binding protein [Nocardiopsis sp. NPDC007018]|uniref:Arc family DNA-binding protein n=1 Tax=Nocardiopsis sp. NPDC007018 TaxID=3155721 RepID=UPI0033C1B631